MRIKTKICYVLNEYNERTDTHLAHKYALLQALKDEADVIVISMKEGFLRGCASMVRARRDGYENFYVHYSFKGALVALAVAWRGGRVFYWNCGMPWLYKRGILEETIFRFILRRTIFVTGTKGIAEEYERRYSLKKENIRVVPNAIDVARFQEHDKKEARRLLSVPQDKNIILFAHHLSRRKGTHVLPNIIKQFVEHDNVLFLIIGSGPEEAWLKRKIQDDNVRFIGSVPNQDMPRYLAAVDVLLMPSEEEGFPNVLLEAMATGVPFVASDVGGVREIVPPELASYVLSENNPDLFVDIIKKILGNTTEQNRISVVEKQWITRYDISSVISQFLSLFITLR